MRIYYRGGLVQEESSKIFVATLAHKTDLDLRNKSTQEHYFGTVHCNVSEIKNQLVIFCFMYSIYSSIIDTVWHNFGTEVTNADNINMMVSLKANIGVEPQNSISGLSCQLRLVPG